MFLKTTQVLYGLICYANIQHSSCSLAKSVNGSHSFNLGVQIQKLVYQPVGSRCFRRGWILYSAHFQNSSGNQQLG